LKRKRGFSTGGDDGHGTARVLPSEVARRFLAACFPRFAVDASLTQGHFSLPTVICMSHIATGTKNHEWATGTFIAADERAEAYAEIERLRAGDESEALEFLEREPLKNVTLIGWINDYGLESPQHRGEFYAHRENGRLDGLALIGHWVLMSGGERAVHAFANAARLRHQNDVEIVLGEDFAGKMFNRLFVALPSARVIRRIQSQYLFAIQEVSDVKTAAEDELRVADLSEIEEVTRAHAHACLEIHGFDKEAADPPGFRQRTRARVEKGCVWIGRDASGVTFKCDVVINTRHAFYLEGLWTRPDMRHRGFSNRMMKALCRKLLQKRPSVCLFADANNERVTAFYRQVGFENLASYHLTWYESALDESGRKMQ
jgi:ribosomal protein S18 acetylase RimI-like enzyme